MIRMKMAIYLHSTAWNMLQEDQSHHWTPVKFNHKAIKVGKPETSDDDVDIDIDEIWRSMQWSRSFDVAHTLCNKLNYLSDLQ